MNFTKVEAAYRSNLWLLGKKSWFEDAHGKFEAELLGTDENGCIVLNKSGELCSYMYKGIVFLEREIGEIKVYYYSLRKNHLILTTRTLFKKTPSSLKHQVFSMCFFFFDLTRASFFTI
jgi:hypothetical protein